MFEKENIKNIHLSIHPLGEIKISVPNKMEGDEIKSFVLLKLEWIKEIVKNYITRTETQEN